MTSRQRGPPPQSNSRAPINPSYNYTRQPPPPKDDRDTLYIDAHGDRSYVSASRANAREHIEPAESSISNPYYRSRTESNVSVQGGEVARIPRAHVTDDSRARGSSMSSSPNRSYREDNRPRSGQSNAPPTASSREKLYYSSNEFQPPLFPQNPYGATRQSMAMDSQDGGGRHSRPSSRNQSPIPPYPSTPPPTQLRYETASPDQRVRSTMNGRQAPPEQDPRLLDTPYQLAPLKFSPPRNEDAYGLFSGSQFDDGKPSQGNDPLKTSPPAPSRPPPPPPPTRRVQSPRGPPPNLNLEHHRTSLNLTVPHSPLESEVLIRTSSNRDSIDDEWPLEQVIEFLRHYGFGEAWQQAFRDGDIHGDKFRACTSLPEAKKLIHVPHDPNKTLFKLITTIRKVLNPDSDTPESETSTPTAQARPRRYSDHERRATRRETGSLAVEQIAGASISTPSLPSPESPNFPPQPNSARPIPRNNDFSSFTPPPRTEPPPPPKLQQPPPPRNRSPQDAKNPISPNVGDFRPSPPSQAVQAAQAAQAAQQAALMNQYNRHSKTTSVDSNFSDKSGVALQPARSSQEDMLQRMKQDPSIVTQRRIDKKKSHEQMAKPGIFSRLFQRDKSKEVVNDSDEQDQLYGQLSPPLPPQPPYNHHKGMNNSQSSLDSSSLSTPIDDPRPASLATSISSLVSVRPPIEPTSAPQPALPPILWVQITTDGEDFRRCELSHTGPDSSVIRERVCQKFGFKPSETALYITDIDGTPDDAEELDDEALLNACTRGDSKGTLKFLLKAKPAPAPPPPPPPPTRTAPPVGKILIPPPSLRPGGSLLSVPDLNVDGRDSRSISISEDPNRKGHYNITPRELYGVEYGNANASGDSANTTKSGPSDYFDIRSPEPLEPSSEPSNRDSNVPLKKEDVNTRIFEAAERAKENRKGRKRTESDGSEKSTPLDPVPYQFNAETPLMSPTRRRPSAQEETGFEKLGGWKMTHPGRVPTRQASLPMSPSSASSFKVIQKENNDNVVDFSNPRLSPYSSHAPTFESSTVTQTSQHLPTRTNSGIKAQRRAPAPPQFPLLPSRTSTVVATQKFPPDIPKRSQYRRVSDASSLNGRRSSEDERPGSRVPSDGTITLGSSDRSGSVPTIVTPENMNLEPMPLPPKRAPSPNTPGARLGITVDTNIGRPIGDSPPTEWRTSISPYSGYESTPAPDSGATNHTNVTPPPPPEKVSTAPATLPDQFKESSSISFDDAPAFDLPDDDDDESLWAVKPIGVDDSPSQSRRTSESVSPPLGPPVIRKKSSLRKPGRPPSKLTVQIDLKVTEIPTPQFSAIAEESATPTVSSFSTSSSAPSDSSSNSSVSRPHHRADSPEYYIGDDRKGLNSPMRVPPSPGTPISAAFGGSGGTDLTRKNSFAKHEDVWAVRPPPDVVLDNLEEYFPNHDLDKPILVDQGNFSPPSSPMDNSDSDTNNATVKPAAKRPNQQSITSSPAPFAKPTARMKSIRVVAKEAMEKRSRLANIAKNVKNANLLRRRSTKVWGMRMMEMTPGQLRTGQIVTADSEDKLERRRTFKWVKGELIGKGTYGSVYVGLNATTGEMLAVKQVEVPHSASDRVDERYKQMMDALNAEIETLKDLDHPHIVQYLGYERTETTISIFLEYVPGGSVGRCLKKHGRFEEPVIRSLIRQTLEGLAYLHARGTLHRDLKADNLLLDLDGVCKISDFGISKQSKDVYANDHYTLAGTIFWMAPEVIQSRKEGYSAKIDIWSLGCVVLEMFAGKRPWSTDEAIGAMFKLGNERKAPPIPDDVLEHMSPEAKDFLDKCFTIDADARPMAAELLKHPFCICAPDFKFSESKLGKAVRFGQK